MYLTSRTTTIWHVKNNKEEHEGGINLSSFGMILNDKTNPFICKLFFDNVYKDGHDICMANFTIT